MNVLCLLLFIRSLSLFASANLYGQPSLRIEKGMNFQLTSEQLLLDSLVMQDSSVLLLDNRYSTNIIRVNFLSIGKYCMLIGSGKDGENGTDGKNGFDRSPGLDGKKGEIGFSAVNLVLSFSKLSLRDNFIINLSGGNGGVGGVGGIIEPSHETNVSWEGKSTKSSPYEMRGANASGGDGGDGGDITIYYPIELNAAVKEKIKINTDAGIGGKPGIPTDLQSPNPYPKEAKGISGANGTLNIIILKSE